MAINYPPASFAGQLHDYRQLNTKDLTQRPAMDKEFGGRGYVDLVLCCIIRSDFFSFSNQVI